MDISKYFRESLGIQDNESRLLQNLFYTHTVIVQLELSLAGKLSVHEYPADIRWNVQALDKMLMEVNSAESMELNLTICLNR